jgi:hypothetical protein
MALILRRASASRPSDEWQDDHDDVLADGVVVGRIFKANAAPVGTSWIWTLAFGQHEDRTPTHGYEATREAAMARSRKAGGGIGDKLMGTAPRPILTQFHGFTVEGEIVGRLLTGYANLEVGLLNCVQCSGISTRR